MTKLKPSYIWPVFYFSTGGAVASAVLAFSGSMAAGALALAFGFGQIASVLTIACIAPFRLDGRIESGD
jgi:hypothetical protein